MAADMYGVLPTLGWGALFFCGAKMAYSYGVLKYSPKMLGDRVSQKWWLILECDPEITKYYRHLFHLFHHKTQFLTRPAWESHITIVRDEEPSIKEFWEKYPLKQVRFEYLHQPVSDGSYWWLPVNCQELLEIRVELGLDPNPQFPLHLSFGHQSSPSVLKEKHENNGISNS